MGRALLMLLGGLLAVVVPPATVVAQGAAPVSPSDEAFLRTLGSLGQLVVLSLVIERSLALVFDLDVVRRRLNGLSGQGSPAEQLEREQQAISVAAPPSNGRGGAVKAFLAYGLSFAVCRTMEYDVLSGIFANHDPSLSGETLTAAVVAGGSAGAMTLFQGFLGMSKESRDARAAETVSEVAVAKSRKDVAEAEQAEAAARKATAEVLLAKAELERDAAERLRDAAAATSTTGGASAHA